MRVFALSLRNSVFPNATADSPNGLAHKLHDVLGRKIHCAPRSESIISAAKERGMTNWERQLGEEIVAYSLLSNLKRPNKPAISAPLAHLLWVRVNPLRKGEEFIVHYGDVLSESVYSCERFEPMITDILTHLAGTKDV